MTDGAGEEQTQTAVSQADLEQQFHQAMIGIYETAKRDTDYKPTYFIQMVSEVGGLETARRLLKKTDLSDGFTELYFRERLDLTVERNFGPQRGRPDNHGEDDDTAKG